MAKRLDIKSRSQLVPLPMKGWSGRAMVQRLAFSARASFKARAGHHAAGVVWGYLAFFSILKE